MRRATLVHPRLLGQLEQAGMFPFRAQIQAPSDQRGSAGSALDTWAPVQGLEDIPAARGTAIGEERRGTEMVVEVGHVVVKLKGYYAGITPEMRCLLTPPSGGIDEVLDIESADVDQLGLMSHLTCRKVTPSAEPGE